MTIDTNTLKEHFFNKAIPTDTDFSNLIDLAANDQNVVVDNHDGTEQLNGVQVQPYNKLSDTIGGRNLLINTAQLNDSTVCLTTKSNISDTYLGLNIFQTANQWDGVKIYWSYLAPKLKTNTNYVMSEYVRNTSPTTSATIGIYGDDAGVKFNSAINTPIVTLPPNSGWTRISFRVNIASFPTTVGLDLRFENTTVLTDGYVQFAGLKLEQGSIATGWTPAPEDKVNVSDMRKPASDVAAIEEVNAKQDKIGYTPADDSKVVHSTDVPQAIVQTALVNGVDLDTVKAPGIYPFENVSFVNYIGTEPQWGYLKVDAQGEIVVQIVYDDDNGRPYVQRKFSGTPGSWSAWIEFADDSKVAHLSGANNFDTVPTYGTNNKPFAINDNGTTSARPTTGIYVGYQYYDTDLKKPIWYNGSAWTDSTGETV